ncbi:hypothetical protein QYM36_013827 [Artemia franciscana]|uniref:Uncharacterized protein n=1 Tax=Artemia franciscana TaxID=6661 RepID=A0AA88L2J5_ARTSF|nr:hypothetical protein QYM36_013827 [Artemia franciscana]
MYSNLMLMRRDIILKSIRDLAQEITNEMRSSSLESEFMFFANLKDLTNKMRWLQRLHVVDDDKNELQLDHRECRGPIQSYEEKKPFLSQQGREGFSKKQKVVPTLQPQKLEEGNSQILNDLFLVPTQDPLPGGHRSSHFVESWKSITDNKFVINVIKEGYRLSFKKKYTLP